MATVVLTAADFAGGQGPALQSNTTYILDANVTITATSGFPSVGSNVVFDGNGKTVTVTNASFAGLFPSTATVKNVGVLASATAGLIRAAGWVFASTVSGTAINCYSTGGIGYESGGIFGYRAGYGSGNIATAIGCYSYGIIGLCCGGIFGQECGSGPSDQSGGGKAIARNCFSRGVIQTTNSIGAQGGIFGNSCGTNGGYVLADTCFSSGLIGEGNGGIFAGNAGSTGYAEATNCYSTGDLNSGNTGSGGIFGTGCGQAGGKAIARNCYSTGIIGSYGGGIFGRYAATYNGNCQAINCYSTGSIGGGGIYGSDAGTSNEPTAAGKATATNCFSRGTIGINIAGGIFSQYTGTNTIKGTLEATNCYSSGTITAGLGIIGVNATGTVTNCYVSGSATASLGGSSVNNSGQSATWSDTTANQYLTGYPGDSINSQVWYSWSPNTPYNLVAASRNSLAYNDLLWIAVGSGINTISYSSNGIAWTGLGSTVFSLQGNSVAWNGSIWVAAGTGTNSLAYSSDGITWTGLGTSLFITGNSVAWNGREWTATGDVGVLATSADGINWVLQRGNVSTSGLDITWNDPTKGSTSLQSILLLGGGTYSSTDSIMYSIDNGKTWTGLSKSLFTVCNSIKRNANMFIAVGGGPNTIAYSLDGINWIGLGNVLGYEEMRDLEWNGTMWVAIITYATFPSNAVKTIYSYDGIIWQNGNTIPPVYSFRTIFWDKTTRRWIIGGVAQGTGTTNQNIVYYSFDGISWTASSNGSIFGSINSTTQIQNFATNGSVIVAIACKIFGASSQSTNNICYSTDGGTTWNSTGTNSFFTYSTEPTYIIWNGTEFIVTSPQSKLVKSKDGIVWYEQTITVPVQNFGLGDIAINLTQIQFINNIYYSIGWIFNSIAHYIYYMISQDNGVTWNIISLINSFPAAFPPASNEIFMWNTFLISSSNQSFSSKERLAITAPPYYDASLNPTDAAAISINLYK